MTKVEAVVIRERVETVIDAVEAETGHVGVTVVEAIGHGRQRGVTHEYRGRVFESRFLPKALLTFIVEDALAQAVIGAIVDAARSGHESGDGIVWTTPIENVRHNRTGLSLGEVERNGGTHGWRGRRPSPPRNTRSSTGTRGKVT
jgi:nitrogen regulatory protein P-II 1